ncbi:MAG: energy transducer TonB, partial [Deltaproteobacteria bacterium]|nr:energy transducer TonB [Deltaproteobacteria bacterium]
MIALLLTLALHGALAQEPEAPRGYERVLHDARPVNSTSFTYPSIAKALRLPPVTCDVEVIVGHLGRVEEVHPLKCPDAFAEAATADMAKWRYTPALVEGAPIRFMSPL